MQSIIQLLKILTLALLVASCTTTPYVRHKTPKINGEIIINQQPASGIKVYLSTNGNDKQCIKSLRWTTTDIYGRFSFETVKEHMNYTPLMTHYLDEWVICADIQGQRQQIHSGNRYGMGSVIESLNLRCEAGTEITTITCRQML